MRISGANILTRYSTDRQNETSTADQVMICRQWCEKHNVPVLAVYSDEAVSGMKDTRPRYEEMMGQLRRGIGDMVVIYDQSRMFRKLTAWFQFRDELELLGVKVISATQPMIGKDLQDPSNFMVEGSMALFNQMWVLQTRARVITTMRHMAQNGQHTGGAPALGYQLVDGELTVCEPEAAIVRRIFSEYAQGRTYRDIIAGLNADGLTTRKGNAFGTNSLHDLLKNEKYIGNMVYGRAPRRINGSRNSHAKDPDNIIRVEGAVPPIIDRETWDRVQAKLAANRRSGSGRPAKVRNYPLKGKVFCGECGMAMVGTTSQYRYHYYACSGKQRRNDCSMLPIKMDDLEQGIADAVREVLGNPDNLDRFVSVLRKESESMATSTKAQLQKVTDKIAVIKKDLDASIDAILQGLFSESLKDRIHRLEHEKKCLEAEQLQLQKLLDSTTIPVDLLEALFRAVIATDDDAVLLALVTRVEVFKDSVKVWTVFDNEDPTPPGSRIYDENNMVPVPEITIVPPASAFIKTLGSGSPAPNQYNPNQVFPVGDGFGFIVFFSKFEDTHFRNGVIKRPESNPRGPRKKKQS